MRYSPRRPIEATSYRCLPLVARLRFEILRLRRATPRRPRRGSQLLEAKVDQGFLRLTKDQQQQAKAADVQDRALVDAFRELERFAPFQEYKKQLLRMVSDRTADVLTKADGTLDGVSHVLASEHVKGTMNGLLLAANLASVTISQWDARQSAAKDVDR